MFQAGKGHHRPAVVSALRVVSMRASSCQLRGVTPEVEHQDTSKISQDSSVPSSTAFTKGKKMLILAHEKAFPPLEILCHPLRSPTARSRYIYLTRNGHTPLEGFGMVNDVSCNSWVWGLNWPSETSTPISSIRQLTNNTEIPWYKWWKHTWPSWPPCQDHRVNGPSSASHTPRPKDSPMKLQAQGHGVPAEASIQKKHMNSTRPFLSKDCPSSEWVTHDDIACNLRINEVW